MTQPFTSFQDFKRRYPIRPNDEGALLGSGSYGRVIKVEDQLETEWVAIKISEFKGNDSKSLRAEVELAQRVPRQANIARYDACHRLETDTSVSDFAIMKYYPDGNLADLLKHITLTPTQIYDITQGILLGLQHLHRHRIVHRDFKPANILISRDNSGRFIPKIADFGLSKLVSDDELDSSDFDLSDGRGTPSYKAPEQIEGSRVSFNLDLWAFGVILYELMTGEKPFRADLKNTSEQSARREIEKKIISVELPARLGQIDEPYGSMIRRCLVRDIHERVRKENDLLDLLDRIPQLLTDAQQLVYNQQYKEAINLYEQVLAKREHHADAQQGLNECNVALEQQYLNSLLNDAGILLAQQQIEQAKSKYEQVLKLAPAHAEAARGLVLCIERLQTQTKLLVVESELTDVYQEEKTDIYVPLPIPIAVKTGSRLPLVDKPSAHTDIVTNLPSQSEVLPKFSVRQPIISFPRQDFPWRVTVPVAISLAGLGLYFTLINTPEPLQKANPISGSTAFRAVGLPADNKSVVLESKVMPKLGESKEALNKRIDIALNKARQAYRRKDYETTVMLTNSVLQLDPTRQGVVLLRDATVKELEKQTPNGDKPTALTAITTEPPKVAFTTPAEPEKSKPSESAEDPKEKLINAKQEQQNIYNELIEDGINAIANGNNKTKAITAFTKAQALAKDQELNTAKAEGAYTLYLNKANKIFATDEFEGAKGWYQVAQALKDTPEVRRKIKLCTNQ